MPHPKPWPDSESEYVMDQHTAMQVAEAAMSDRPIAKGANAVIRGHNTATFALVALRVVAEKYYEAAGFRE